MRVYIAGPMTGIKDFNYPAFDKAAAAWREKGWLVENPAEHFNRDQTLPYRRYMRLAILTVINCDAIATLPGWIESRGATLEMGIAMVLGLSVFDANRPVEVPS